MVIFVQELTFVHWIGNKINKTKQKIKKAKKTRKKRTKGKENSRKIPEQIVPFLIYPEAQMQLYFPSAIFMQFA